MGGADKPGLREALIIADFDKWCWLNTLEISASIDLLGKCNYKNYHQFLSRRSLQESFQART